MEIFGSYMNKDRTLYGEAVQICALTLCCNCCRTYHLPACFSFGVQPDQGPALIFVTLPNVFIKYDGRSDLGYAFLSVYDMFKLFNGYCRV